MARGSLEDDREAVGCAVLFVDEKNRARERLPARKLGRRLGKRVDECLCRKPEDGRQADPATPGSAFQTPRHHGRTTDRRNRLEEAFVFRKNRTRHRWRGKL